ncbi:Na(+)-translocating NADH-quinone reductase subunit A [Croceimicrobium sp.]|uniref:Na(+)-translocating NADH-quinone reductase subunit A n=1 Tax=Croceimicrobium sp. TaxID=2828340 RepID=UPI003BADA314
MSEVIKIKKGVDIKLQGEAEKIFATADTPSTYALKPSDFPGIRMKLKVKEGDEVLAGDPIFFDKGRPAITFGSPVSGEIAEVVRGEKRRILEVRVLADKEIRYRDFGSADPASLKRDEVKGKIVEAGMWPLVKQRPYNIVANPDRVPRDIWVSCFDSAPLAPDADFVVHGQEAEFKTGIKALMQLTDGKVHLGLDGRTNPSEAFKVEGAVMHRFTGPHPAGNPGVQMHAVAPINKGETVWTVGMQDVIMIGRLFMSGQFQAQRSVALAGAQVSKPRYYKALIGANVKSILEGNVAAENNRYISGNILTGTQIPSEGYLSYYDNQITVMPEGGEDQFFGWMAPNFNKFSISRALFNWMMPNKRLNLDANLNGEERAFVVTGEYEKVFPFDIYPVQLLKSIMVKDIEAMENLGIYEVAEEDMALCEVVCTSKIPVQETLREGLDLMLDELGD